VAESKVEATLRNQREAWREIAERTARVSSRELPPEPPKRILLFGVGSSHYAARLTGLTLIRDRSRPRLPVTALSSLSVGTEVIPTRGDWAFAFTHRGGNAATHQAIEICERAGAFTIQVSAQGAREDERSRFFLPTCPLETVEPHTVAVTGAICAVTTLLLGAKAIEEWDALRSIGDPDLDLFRRRAGQGPSVIVGEWEGEWLAREGALKFMEMARLPVRAFSTEEFFHGPRFSVRSEDPIWHVSMPKDSRNNELQPAHRIGIFGSTPLAWIPALVELQWLALATALNRGVDPDSPGA
jgi:fructoselysine-6-P-deglycase FrlB-like protein